MTEPADCVKAVHAAMARVRQQYGAEWCDVCEKPQWISADGTHECATIPELHAALDRAFRQWWALSQR